MGELDLLNRPPNFEIAHTILFGRGESVLLPDKPGIYFIHDFRGILYIGRTENLKNRFHQHRWNCKNSRLREVIKQPIMDLKFSWMLINFPEQIQKEKELISYFSPFCNFIK
ncbi:GIY-YIG nuclease family protein [Bacillus cereus]|uniref:GIY-YIG nuclease family protein n=1 Tax=Bacillus cereus TaxID=1396 RepID=UPI0015D4E496|nr:GIY-YIG nuclease family protein [Bacillus cereus]